MKATELLRDDHKLAWRLEKVIRACVDRLEAGGSVPLDDITRMTDIIDGFLDSVHHSREEDTYFPCVGAYGMREEIRTFLIEHEFGRRIAVKIAEHTSRWRRGEDAREAVIRFLATYAVFLRDHMTKEERFFEEAERTISAEEEAEMREYFESAMLAAKTTGRIDREIGALEQTDWYAYALKDHDSAGR